MAKSKKINKKEERVFVEWIDSMQFTRPWWSIKEFIEESKQPSIMTSIGYKFHEDKYFIYIATSQHWDRDEVVSFGGINSIPKGSILKIKKI